MVSASVVCLSSLLLLLFVSSSVSSSAMDQVCGNLGDSYVTPEICAKVLSADPRSRTAPDAQTVASISIDICTAIGARIVDSIKAAAAGAGDDYGKLRAKAALTIMEDVVASFKFAKTALAAKFKSPADAMIFVGKYALESVAVAVTVPNDLVNAYADATTVSDAIFGHL